MINDLKTKIGSIIRSKNILSLAVEDNCLMAADLHYDGNELKLNGVARLVFPDGVSFEKSAEMGVLLKQFLRDNGFRSKKSVIGIPAKWFMMREKSIPPSSQESIAGMLKIYAGREFSISAEELVIDYTGDVSQEHPGRLFLGALRRKYFESVLETARLAGLNVISVTPTSFALSTISLDMTDQGPPDYFLYIRPDFVEILTGENGQVTGVRHIERGKSFNTDHLATALKRFISLQPDNGQKTEKLKLLIWDESKDGDQEALDIKNLDLPRVDISEIDTRTMYKKMMLRPGKGDGSSLPFIVGRTFTEAHDYYLDFYNSRMEVKKKIVKKKYIVWASAIAVALIIFLLSMVISWKGDRNNIRDLKLRLAEMSEDISSAREIIQRVTLASGWYSERPEMLRCLRELTLTFPVEGRVWATNLALNEDMKGIVSGKAVDEKSVIEVLDNLKDNKMFSNTQMIHIRESGQGNQEVSFSMSFSFTGRG